MPSAKPSKNLVVLPYGNSSLHSDWIFNPAGRNFDVILLFYHPDITNPSIQTHTDAFSLRHYQDFKWWMIQRLFREEGDLLHRYDYFYFPDDDIVTNTEDINFLFRVSHEFNLKLSQPALSMNSFKSWRVLRRKRMSGIRYLSAVELMCPLMSSDTVSMLLDTFALTRSGWGLDILWGEQIRGKFGDKSIAVFDTIVVEHIKPVGRGELYDKINTPAAKERDEIFERFKITIRKIYGLPLPENQWLGQWKSYNLMKKLKSSAV